MREEVSFESYPEYAYWYEYASDPQYGLGRSFEFWMYDDNHEEGFPWPHLDLSGGGVVEFKNWEGVM